MKTIHELNAGLAEAMGNVLDAWNEYDAAADLLLEGRSYSTADVIAAQERFLAAEQTYSAAYQEREAWYAENHAPNPLDFDDDDGEDEDDDGTSLSLDMEIIAHGNY